eukprot:310194-Rhodomonas_salina.1
MPEPSRPRSSRAGPWLEVGRSQRRGASSARGAAAFLWTLPVKKLLRVDHVRHPQLGPGPRQAGPGSRLRLGHVRPALKSHWS